MNSSVSLCLIEFTENLRFFYINWPHVKYQICIENAKIEKLRTYVSFKYVLEKTYVFQNAKNHSWRKIWYFTLGKSFFSRVKFYLYNRISLLLGALEQYTLKLCGYNWSPQLCDCVHWPPEASEHCFCYHYHCISSNTEKFHIFIFHFHLIRFFRFFWLFRFG